MLFLDVSIIIISSLTENFSITRSGLGRMRKKSHEGSVYELKNGTELKSHVMLNLEVYISTSLFF